MSARTLVAALAAAALALPGVASAEDAQQGVNVGTQIAGTIIETVITGLPDAKRSEDSPGPGYSLTGECTFWGVLTPNNRLQITYAGYDVAEGPQIPQLTYIKCTVANQHGQTASSEFANGGPISQTGSAAGPWFVSPITVCIEGFAVFGPTPVNVIRLQKSCATPTA